MDSFFASVRATCVMRFGEREGEETVSVVVAGYRTVAFFFFFASPMFFFSFSRPAALDYSENSQR